MKLLLVRHGETDWNVAKRIQGSTDIPLNSMGLAQAGALAQELSRRAVPVAAVYTSRLSRAAQTAGIIAERLGIVCQAVPGLEEINFGLWEGICWEEVVARFPDEYLAWQQNRRYGHPPQGESYDELLRRFLPALKTLCRQHSGREDGDFIVVTHSACAMALLSLLNNTPFHEMVKRYKLANTAVVELDADTDWEIDKYDK